ncbi:putative bifunctional diguanylate cyclase/phosphodiesterase [Marinibaculum pumilum]|uniref:Bifunctional diguanylate cyclase/phosphodiesterase n=1 Tax=Marinibaculum pumilum TaxID=1766165 RepID=A0ABV7L3R7_9PROT
MLYAYVRDAEGVLHREWVIGGEDLAALLPARTTAGSIWRDLVVPEDRVLIDRREGRLRAGRYSEEEVRIRTGSGLRRLRLLGYPKRYRDGRHRIVCAAVDLTAAEAPGGFGDRDPLTGLANYPAFQDALEAAIAGHAGAGEAGTAIAVLFINLNAYNEIAQNFGVPAADSAAVAAAQRLREIAPGQARLGRIHTDEFVCFMPDLQETALRDLVHGFEAALDSPLDVEGIDVSVEPVIGIACFPNDGDRPRHLVRRAAIAAAVALRSGQSWHLFAGERDAVRHNLTLMQDLRRALRSDGDAGDGLWLAYQPQLDLASGRIRGVEALLRWRHPVLGAVPPGDFLPQAEATRLIHDIFHWTLAQGLAQLARWRSGEDREAGGLVLALNLSARNLADPGLAEDVLAALAAAGLPPQALTLEVTETALFVNEAGTGQLATLRAAGLGISIDDFGTGYSSLGYLQRLPATELKIDRCFTAEIERSPANRRLVSLAVNVAQGFGMATVAEGVESAAALETLRALGCDLAQGFHLCRPLAAGDPALERLLAGDAAGPAAARGM